MANSENHGAIDQSVESETTEDTRVNVVRVDDYNLLSIGSTVALLQREFPSADVSVSKLRFLEDQKIVSPARTASGYRKYSASDIDRLRYCIKVQSENFLPLRVIRKNLKLIDKGFVPAIETDTEPQVPMSATQGHGQGGLSIDGANLDTVELTLDDLAKAAGMSTQEVVTLSKSGFIKTRPGHDYFGSDALSIIRLISELKDLGLDAKHLSPVKIAARKQSDVIESTLSLGLKANLGPFDELKLKIDRLSELTLGLERAMLEQNLREALGTDEVPQ